MHEIPSPEKPFRERRDGMTAERREAFLQALEKIGTVAGACRAIGISITSARRAKARIAEFGRRWDAIQTAHTGAAVEEAMRRGVEGWEEPIFHGGKQVGVRKRYSDGLLKTVINRSDRASEAEAPPMRARAPAEATDYPARHGRGHGRGLRVKHVPIEEAHAEVMRRLDRLMASDEEKEKKAAAVAADRMRAAGLCP